MGRRIGSSFAPTSSMRRSPVRGWRIVASAAELETNFTFEDLSEGDESGDESDEESDDGNGDDEGGSSDDDDE